MAFQLKVSQKGMILVLVPVILELGFVAATGMLLLSEARHLAEVEHSKRILLRAQRLYSIANRTVQLMDSTAIGPKEKAERLAELEPYFSNNDPFGELSETTDPDLIELTHTDYNDVREQLAAFMRRGQKAMSTSQAAVNEFNLALKSPEMLSLIMAVQDLNCKFLAIEDRMVKGETLANAEFQAQLTKTIWSGAAFIIAVALLLMTFFTRDILLRLKQISSKTQLIAVGKPLPPADQSSDEIGELDRVIFEASKTLDDARLRESAIFDGTAHVMCSLDNKLRIQTVSKSSVRVWHYEVDELLGKSLLSLIVPTRLEEIRTAFEQITDAKPEGKLETPLRCGDGTIKNMLWNINWRNDRFYCVVQDVTELRNLEQLKQHFFSMASHDLRSPLTAIGMNIQMVTAGAKGPVSAGVQKELDGIESSLSQLMSLVNEVLALEKLEAAKTTLTLSAVNAADVCESAREALAEFAKQHRVTIGTPIGSALLHADEGEMERAVTSLIAGAIKFSKPDSRIFVKVRKQASTGFIEIHQDSYSIPPHEADLIFDKLRQTYVESNRPVKRVGLGFALVKAIAEAHGGSVGVDAGPRKHDDGGTSGASSSGGSTIWMGIPLHQEDIDT